MAILTVGPSGMYDTLDAALTVVQDDDTIQLLDGAAFTSKRIHLTAPGSAPQTFTLVVTVNGAEKARETVSKGDVVAVTVE